MVEGVSVDRYGIFIIGFQVGPAGIGVPFVGDIAEHIIFDRPVIEGQIQNVAVLQALYIAGGVSGIAVPDDFSGGVNGDHIAVILGAHTI